MTRVLTRPGAATVARLARQIGVRTVVGVAVVEGTVAAGVAGWPVLAVALVATVLGLAAAVILAPDLAERGAGGPLPVQVRRGAWVVVVLALALAPAAVGPAAAVRYLAGAVLLVAIPSALSAVRGAR